MHISTANIVQMVADMTGVTIQNNIKFSYGLFIGILTFDLTHCKVQGQGHVSFVCQYLANSKR